MIEDSIVVNDGIANVVLPRKRIKLSRPFRKFDYRKTTHDVLYLKLHLQLNAQAVILDYNSVHAFLHFACKDLLGEVGCAFPITIIRVQQDGLLYLSIPYEYGEPFLQFIVSSGQWPDGKPCRTQILASGPLLFCIMP